MVTYATAITAVSLARSPIPGRPALMLRPAPENLVFRFTLGTINPNPGLLTVALDLVFCFSQRPGTTTTLSYHKKGEK